MDEAKLTILEKTGSTDVQELVAEVRRRVPAFGAGTVRKLRELTAKARRRVDDLPMEYDDRAHEAFKATRELADAVDRLLG